MPQLAVAAVAYVAKAFTVKAIAAFVVRTVVTAALTAGAQALTKKSVKQSAQARQAQGTTLSLGEVSREAVVGRASVGGSLIDGFNHGGQYGTGNVTLCIALADHAVDGLEAIIIDGQAQAFVTSGVQSGWNGKLSVQFVNATAGGATPPAVALAAGWTADDRLSGVTHVWVTYECDEKTFTQGHPKFEFVVRGLKVYDPRKDAALGYTGPDPQSWDDPSTHAFSENAALIRYAYARGIYAEGRQGQAEHLLIGRGLSAVEAPPERVIAAANLCDELADFGQPRYRAAGLIRADDDFITVEEMLASAMAGVIVQRSGGVEVEPGQAKAAVVTITDDDLVVGEPVTFQPFLGDGDSGRVNTVVPRYVSPEQGWREHSGAVRRDLADIVADGGPREVTLSLPLVTAAAQADACAEIYRRLGRLERRATIVLPPDFAPLEEGDWIAWQSARRHGGATVRYRIEKWSQGADWRMRLALREIASSVYGVPDPVEDQAEPPPPPVPVDAITLPGATAEAVTLPGETSVIPGVRFRWDTPVDPAVRAIRGEVRLLGGTEVATSRTEDLTLGEDGWIVTNGVTPSATIQARLVPIGVATRPVVPSPWFTLTTGDLVVGELGGVAAVQLIAELRAVQGTQAEIDRAAEALIASALDDNGRISGVKETVSVVVTDLRAEVETRTSQVALLNGSVAVAQSQILTVATDLAAEVTARQALAASTTAGLASVNTTLTAVSNQQTVQAGQITTAQSTANGASSTATFALSALNGNQAYVALLTDVGGRLTAQRINGVTGAIQFLSESVEFLSGSTGARTVYSNGIWTSYSADNTVRSMWGRPFGGSEGLVWWTGPNSTPSGSETKAGAYVYVAMTAPRFGGSDVPTGGGGGSSGYAAGRRSVPGVLLDAAGGAWVNVATFTLQGVPASPSINLVYYIFDVEGGSLTYAQFRLLRGSTVLDTSATHEFAGDGTTYVNASLGNTDTASGTVTYTLQRRVTAGGGAAVNIEFEVEAGQSI